MISAFFAQYKIYFILAALAIYSYGIWSTSAKVTENSYLKDKADMLQQVAEQKQANQKIADDVGAAVATKLTGLSTKLGQLRDDLSTQINTVPVYRTCLTTPDVMHSLSTSRDSVNEAIGK